MTSPQALLWRSFLVCGLSFSSLGCGDDEASGRNPPAAEAGQGGSAGEGGEGAGGSGGDPGACTPLELGRRKLHYNFFGELTGVRVPLTTSIGDEALPDYVLIELYDSTTPT